MEAIMNDDNFTSSDSDNDKNFSFFDKIKFIFHFIIKIILYFLFVILIIAGILFLCYFFDMAYNLKQGTYKPPLFNTYIIVSPSMVPTIEVSDAIVIKREDPKKLKVGDIITFNSNDPRYSGITITHRIVKIDKSQDGKLLFQTKGDANNAVDMSYTKESDVYGKVLFKIPKLGYVQYFLSQSYGWLLAIVLPCLSIIAMDIVKLLKNIGISLFGNKDKEIEEQEVEDEEEKDKVVKKEVSNNVEVLDDLETLDDMRDPNEKKQ